MDGHGVNRDERGDTYIELLIGMVIAAFAVIAIMGALMTATSASTEHRSLTNSDGLVKTYLEQATYQIDLASSPAFQNCSTASYYNSKVSFTNPPGYSGYTVSITSVVYWSGTSFDATISSSSCSSTSADKNGIQEIVATAIAPDGSSARLATVVRDPNYASCYVNFTC